MLVFVVQRSEDVAAQNEPLALTSELLHNRGGGQALVGASGVGTCCEVEDDGAGVIGGGVFGAGVFSNDEIDADDISESTREDEQEDDDEQGSPCDVSVPLSRLKDGANKSTLHVAGQKNDPKNTHRQDNCVAATAHPPPRPANVGLPSPFLEAPRPP